jgi:hypothetical protein
MGYLTILSIKQCVLSLLILDFWKQVGVASINCRQLSLLRKKHVALVLMVRTKHVRVSKKKVVSKHY